MPYIPLVARERLAETASPLNAGELNYYLTVTCLEYLDEQGHNYTNYNTVIGALECAKLELYRRQVVPYEEIKITENGDV
jgi:hypothetical protein